MIPSIGSVLHQKAKKLSVGSEVFVLTAWRENGPFGVISVYGDQNRAVDALKRFCRTPGLSLGEHAKLESFRLNDDSFPAGTPSKRLLVHINWRGEKEGTL